jgi:hypothetical protein
MVAERLKLQYIVGTFGGLECSGLLGIFFIFYFYVRYSTTASSTTPQIPLCRRMLRLGLPSKFRSEKILRNRLGTVFVILYQNLTLHLKMPVPTWHFVLFLY